MSKPADLMHIIHDMAVKSKCFDGMCKDIILTENADCCESDWSAHDVDGWTWCRGSPYIEFGQYGVAIIVCEVVEKVGILKREVRRIKYAVMKPDVWVEYGYPQVDYEVHSEHMRPDAALGAAASLIVSDIASNFYPMHDDSLEQEKE